MTATNEPPFRIGHRVPRNVYWNDEPIFMAATDEIAAKLVELLNRGSIADSGQGIEDRERLRRGDRPGAV